MKMCNKIHIYLFLLGLSCFRLPQIYAVDFFARPFEANEGEEILFKYLPGGDSPEYRDIQSWQWDFDGDGNFDSSGTVGVGVSAQEIDTVWTAVFDEGKGSGDNAVRHYTPRLRLVLWSGTEIDSEVDNPAPGITEDVKGLDGMPDPTIAVSRDGLLNPALTVTVFGSPRLARASDPRTDEIKLYMEATFNRGFEGEITNFRWDFNKDGIADITGPERDILTTRIFPDELEPMDHQWQAPPAGSREVHTIGVSVEYVLNRADGTTSNPAWTNWEVKKDFLVIEDVPPLLSMGRSYRQGFPERYGWEDIIATYSSAGAGGDRHVYFHFLEDAYYEQYSNVSLDPNDDTARRNFAESINELLQGQSLRGFQGMVDALRVRYPRITSLDDPPERLPAPAGAREETAALDTAALDFQQSVQFAAFAARAFGPEIMRPGLEEEPAFPQFPRYLSFEDSTLSYVPIPIKNEYWQLSTAAQGQAQARTEKAKLLWRTSVADENALQEAKEECKIAAIQSYLAMALMAAGQSPDEFEANEGNGLFAQVDVATDLFDKINAGVNPLGTDGSYIPNESFGAIYQDAQEAVADAREAELRARDERRLFDRNQADLRNELQGQRSQYITPLKLLTGIDPAGYNNLSTILDQRDYRNTFDTRLNYLEQNYPDADPSGLGEFGAQVAAILDAELNLQDQITSLNNLYESVKISRWANAEIDLINEEATQKLKVHDIIRGYVNSLSVSKGFPSGVNVSFSPGSIVSGYLNAEDRDIERIRQAKIADIQLEAEIRKSLLQVANYTIAIRRAKAQLDQSKLRLESMRAQMERYIEDLAHVRDSSATLYFMDPSFRVSASLAEQRAIAELDFSIDRLYRLARTLEYEWVEPYQNPVSIPPSSLEPPALENPLFDKFTELGSLFIVRSADEAKDYLDALRAWDSKLRRVNGGSVRGPNNAEPISAVPISLREDVFGFVPDPDRGVTLADTVEAFRNVLENNRFKNPENPLNRTLDLRFGLGIADNTYFPTTGSRWNMRIVTIAIDLFSDSGFSDQQVAEIDLIQNRMVSLRTFAAGPPKNYVLETEGNLDRTVFATAFPARINGASGGRPVSEFDDAGLAGRPLGCTEWILRINTENQANRNIDFSKLKDIVLRFTYTYGNPPEFAGF